MEGGKRSPRKNPFVNALVSRIIGSPADFLKLRDYFADVRLRYIRIILTLLSKAGQTENVPFIPVLPGSGYVYGVAGSRCSGPTTEYHFILADTPCYGDVGSSGQQKILPSCGLYCNQLRFAVK